MLLKKSCQRLLKILQICSCWWNINSTNDEGTVNRNQTICLSKLLQIWMFMIQETPLKWRSRELYPCIFIRMGVSLKSSQQNFFTSQKVWSWPWCETDDSNIVNTTAVSLFQIICTSNWTTKNWASWSIEKFPARRGFFSFVIRWADE